MIHYKTGDILQSSENIIVQQVNHKKVMGAGLAMQIRNRYPTIYSAYSQFCDWYDWEYLKKTGKSYWHYCPDVAYPERFFIVCIFGQESYGRNNLYTDYVALKNGLRNMKEDCKISGYSIAIPYGIGCGLAGGDWNIVSNIIESVFDNYEATIYKLK